MNAAPQLLCIQEPAVPDHWVQATTLMREYAEWILSTARIDPFTKQPSFARELDDLAEHYANPHRTLLMALIGDELVGIVAVVRHPDRTAELKRMFVRPAARGRGVADELIARATDLAAVHRCDHVWLESVRGAMDPAIAVYQRNGFRFVEDSDPTMSIEGLVAMRRDLSVS